MTVSDSAGAPDFSAGEGDIIKWGSTDPLYPYVVITFAFSSPVRFWVSPTGSVGTWVFESTVRVSVAQLTEMIGF